MNPVLEQKPDHWLISISGQIDEVEDALSAIKENQREAWGEAEPEWESDDYDATASVKIRFIDISMVRLVSSILRSDYPDIHIIANRGEYNDNANGSV